MAGSLNKVLLIGNLGRDPEIRHTNDGSKVAQLSLATTESWKDKMSGERKDKTEWHRVVIFNDRLCDVAEKYLKKGSRLYVEGQLQTRKWTDNTGQDRYTTEIVISKFKGEMTLLDTKASSGGFESGAQDPFNSPTSSPSSSSFPDLDDDIPF
ncbi:MAG TPA: single-stranded DNA-binding protein [Alphaproteobacteria bacterium]|nr:single-stranded DNA-binding protein [Alphaproteobacteria bacterium]